MLTETQRAYQRDWYHRNKEERRVSGRARMKTRRAQNPEGAKQASKKWREKNPEHLKNYLLKKTYGIDLAQKAELFRAQGSRCAICQSATIKGRNWHVDHCHQTKRVRGILCSRCNLMIGHAKDAPSTLIAAAEYLKR